MIILAPSAPSGQKEVVAWLPWGRRESELSSSAKRLEPEKLNRLSRASAEFARSIKDFVSSTGRETGGLSLTEESLEAELEEFRKRIQRFEVIANPMISAAVSIHDELRSRGLRAPFGVYDPVKGREIGLDESYMSILDTAKAAEANWSEDAFKRAYLSIIAGRMMSFHKGISDWASKYADPRFIERADRMDVVDSPGTDFDIDESRSEVRQVMEGPRPSRQPGPSAQPSAPQKAPRAEPFPADAPYFAATGKEKDAPHKGKSKSQLRDDVLDALRANSDKLPDDLKATFPKLIQFFRSKSSIRTAGFMEAVYDKRKSDVSSLLRLFYGQEYEKVKPFEEGVLSWLERTWDAEDFPEIEPESIDDVVTAFRDMSDRGENPGTIQSELSSMLMKLSKGDENRLNALVKEKPGLFRGGPMAGAVEAVRQAIRSKLRAAPPSAPRPLIPKPFPMATQPPVPESSPAPAPVPVQAPVQAPAQAPVQAPAPAQAPARPLPHLSIPQARPLSVPLRPTRKGKPRPRS